MKIEKIENGFVNEFEGEAQSCWDDCTEYRGKTSGINSLIRRAGYKGDASRSDLNHLAEIKDVFGYYCYREKTPKTCIYW
ncbi:MAG: hypothetical protein IKV85_04140 [Ruminococcus sp.]|nr:hypothetical protein [Ruminococcus sp.]